VHPNQQSCPGNLGSHNHLCSVTSISRLHTPADQYQTASASQPRPNDFTVLLTVLYTYRIPAASHPSRTRTIGEFFASNIATWKRPLLHLLSILFITGRLERLEPLAIWNEIDSTDNLPSMIPPSQHEEKFGSTSFNGHRRSIVQRRPPCLRIAQTRPPATNHPFG
jgi:hypothetical protein